jgi:hypothetical protein
MWYAIDRLVRLIPFRDIQAGSRGRADKKGEERLKGAYAARTFLE